MIDLFFVYTRFDDNIQQENELIQNDGWNIARQIATYSKNHLISGKDQQIQTRLDRGNRGRSCDLCIGLRPAGTINSKISLNGVSG